MSFYLVYSINKGEAICYGFLSQFCWFPRDFESVFMVLIKFLKFVLWSCEINDETCGTIWGTRSFFFSEGSNSFLTFGSLRCRRQLAELSFQNKHAPLSVGATEQQPDCESAWGAARANKYTAGIDFSKYFVIIFFTRLCIYMTMKIALLLPL